MNILYQVTILPPKLPAGEAITQEINALRARFGGEVVYVNPNQYTPLFIPRLLFGFFQLKQLQMREGNLDLHHLYNPDPFPFPYLRYLRRPVIYSISCGVDNKRPNIAFFNALTTVVAADERSLLRLQGWGMKNVRLVRPGIDTTRFTHSPLSLRSDIHLMVGSAPWTKAQFRTKGVDALLSAAQQCPQLHLVFLWRGVLAKEMEEQVQRLHLEKQVEVLNRQVDVNQVLARVHASITLASNPAIIKSYPHSLLDSLAAGKPVLVSRAIPMADYVEQTGCGQVVEHVTAADILTAVETLADHYDDQAQVARQVGQRDFSQQIMTTSFHKVYEQVLNSI